ncbi:hypothetical protein QE152_g7989 [Popillia japonica]|uniref:Uncharacterized protein n=1 Tax=Popillia japonica TaxID=7064 RepID=A0AAW1MCQ7_POPJA
MRTRSSAARPRRPRLHLHIKLRDRGTRLSRVEEIRPNTVTRNTTMKLIFAIFLAILALVKSQYYGFDELPSNAFSGGLDASYRSTRDPRQNRGPVLFPQAPPDNGETSGVIVGASGYGFVPPQQRSYF